MTVLRNGENICEGLIAAQYVGQCGLAQELAAEPTKSECTEGRDDAQILRRARPEIDEGSDLRMSAARKS